MNAVPSAAPRLMRSGRYSPTAQGASGASRKGHTMLEDGAASSPAFTP